MLREGTADRIGWRGVAPGASRWLVVRSGLLLDVLLDDFEWCAAATQDAVTAAPKHRFLINTHQIRLEFIAKSATGPGFKGVHKIGQRRRRRQFEQQMNMVRFAIAFQQLASPSLARRFCFCLCFERRQHGRG